MAYKYLKTTVSFFIILFVFVGCGVQSPSLYFLKKDTLILGDRKNPVFIKLNNANFKIHSFGCTDYSYTFTEDNKEYGKLFVENIELSFNCRWNGLPSGFFEYNFRSNLKLSDVETVENIDIGGYSFRTFKVDDSYYSIIYIYLGQSDRFIVDYEGRLYDELLKSFKKDYVNKFINKKRFYKYYDDSLVRKNIINHYFSAERRFFRD